MKTVSLKKCFRYCNISFHSLPRTREKKYKGTSIGKNTDDKYGVRGIVFVLIQMLIRYSSASGIFIPDMHGQPGNSGRDVMNLHLETVFYKIRFIDCPD